MAWCLTGVQWIGKVQAGVFSGGVASRVAMVPGLIHR